MIRPVIPAVADTPPPLTPGAPLLVIEVQHGLCNRLRALASAVSVARATGRALLVVWCRDAHCGAALPDLLDWPGPVIDRPDAAAAFRARAARVYDYLEIDPRAVHREPVLAPGDAPGGDVYVRSADTLAGPHRSLGADDAVLRALVPAAPVRAILDRAPAPAAVAAHVRMATGPGFDHLAPEAPGNWPAHRHAALAAARAASHADRFAARLDALVEAGRADSIFLAADLPETYARFAARYGDRLRVLRRDAYDRSATQLQYALADLVLLARAGRLLASGYSSFSDVAQRLAPPGRPVERSGHDF